MAATLRLEIVTPESRAYSDDVELVVIPAVEGEMGIYPQHVPLITAITPGELVVTKGGKTTYLAVGEGFVEVTAEKVSVLVDMALTEEAIDEKAAEEAVKRAEARLKEQLLGDEEAALVQAAIAKSLAQLHVKRRRRSA
ncbi:MAG: ATP synthase F1 subunit epsilon [Chthoniobacteraceae bacterium]